jgi:ankyrin repeat protein
MPSKSVPPLPAASSVDDDASVSTAGEHKKKQRVYMSTEKRHSLLGREEGKESFNLDEYQLKKLNLILERVAVRKKHEVEYDPSLSRSQIRLLQLEELIIGENAAYKAKRAENSQATMGIKLAIIGDELQLRQLIHRQGVRAINSRDIFSGRNPLHEAVASGHLHIVKMFLDEYRCNPNVLTLLGSTTALHIACERGFRQIASLLLSFGAHINARDFRGCTPMHVCSTKPCVKLLLRYWEHLNPLIKSAEGLLPSAHYWKYTDDDDKITEIQTIMIKAEEKRAQENARMNRIRQKLQYDESMGDRDSYPDVRSLNSTLPDGGKNAYKYKIEDKKKNHVPKIGQMKLKQSAEKGSDSD